MQIFPQFQSNLSWYSDSNVIETMKDLDVKKEFDVLKMHFKFKQFDLFCLRRIANICTSQHIFCLRFFRFLNHCDQLQLLIGTTSHFQSQATLTLQRQETNERSSLAEKY